MNHTASLAFDLEQEPAVGQPGGVPRMAVTRGRTGGVPGHGEAAERVAFGPQPGAGLDAGSPGHESAGSGCSNRRPRDGNARPRCSDARCSGCDELRRWSIISDITSLLNIQLLGEL